MSYYGLNTSFESNDYNFYTDDFKAYVDAYTGKVVMKSKITGKCISFLEYQKLKREWIFESKKIEDLYI
jgi:methyltransferase-like protein